MVVKKYLCAAPRPESWEGKAEALLKSVGGDKLKLEQLARRTLGMLNERHHRKHEKKRTGPGRKSNAEHAIAFYEYLAGEKGIGDKDDNEYDSSGSGDDDENSSGDESSSSSSSSKTIDTEDFLNQHNDSCDVCNLGGELICCSTCTLVFHEECLRPVLKSIPSDWSCPYCITQGIKNYKRHSKTWKSAASGIRQMKRMKMEFQRGTDEQKENVGIQGDVQEENIDKSNVEESKATNTTESTEAKSIQKYAPMSLKEKGEGNGETKGETSKNSISEETKEHEELKEKVGGKKISGVGGNASATSSVSSAGATSGSKRNLELCKLADSYTKSTENLLVHGRRQRKQPTLYEPQMCADSRWKSDEKNIDTDSNEDDDDTNSNNCHVDTGTSKEDKTDSNSRHRSRRKAGDVIICIDDDNVLNQEKIGSPFCNFCSDDASIPICVFCGCRACFGKHDRDTLLLCDNCDDEYHTQCLGLESVPTTQNWFCPSCVKIKSSTDPKLLSTRRASSASTLSSAAEAHNETDYPKRSSPKSTRSSLMTTARTPTIAVTRATSGETSDRTPKSKAEKESTPSLSTSRKRVRTPKAIANSVEMAEHRKRGRLSKPTTNAVATNSLSAGKKRGRPPKTAPTITPTVLSKSSPISTPRKRGRPPKPSPDPIEIPTEVDSEVKKKVLKPTTPSSHVSQKKSSISSEVVAKIQEPVKVSRVSGRTVKRACFHDEVDEGEQHLRSMKSEEIQSTNNNLKAAAPPKSQETQIHRANNKTPELSEPVRKKPKPEEKSPSQIKTTPIETKSSKSRVKASTILQKKEEEIFDPPPVAPVRMKPILQPPAPPIAPVRMKPALQPPAPPIIRSLISVPEKPKQPIEIVEPNAEETKKPVGELGASEEEKNKLKKLETGATATITKSEVTKKIQPPPATTLQSTINKPATTTVTKDAVPTNATPRPSTTVAQDTPSSRSASAMPHYPSTPLLDPVALEAAIKALPEPKLPKGEKTGVTKTPRRKPGARECMQISRRFGVNIIPEKYMTTLLDYCRRGKVEHLIKMRERLDCHSRFLEYQLAGLEARVKEVGESNIVVPPLPPTKRDTSSRHRNTPPPTSMNKKSFGGSSTKVSMAAQNNGKKPVPPSQALGVSASKIGKAKKPPPKMAVAPKLQILSSIPTASKPVLPVSMAHKNKD